jgi:hypothetical protein
VPLAALGVYVNDSFVALVGSAAAPVWNETAPGKFEALIVSDKDEPVVRVTRIYEIKSGTYDFTLRQTVKNESAQPVKVRWLQLGSVDLPGDASGYGGDRRRVQFGFLLSPALDPSRRLIQARDYMLDHNHALGTPDRSSGVYPVEATLWPAPAARAIVPGADLSWSA